MVKKTGERFYKTKTISDSFELNYHHYHLYN